MKPAKIKYLLLPFLFACLMQAQAEVSLSPTSSNNSFTITCSNPSIVLGANNTISGSIWLWTWYSPYSAPVNNSTILVTQPGNYTVIALDMMGVDTLVVPIYINTVSPVSSVFPSTASVSCLSVFQPQFSLATTSPTQNFTSYVCAPYGGSFAVNATNFSYQATSTGTYTYIVKDNINGCKSENYFTVITDSTLPTPAGNLAGTFTVGCGIGLYISCPVINYQGPLTYTLIGPGTSTTISSSILSTISTYSTNLPGNYTFVVRSAVNLCTTYLPFTIHSNTTAPGASITPATPILSCANSSLLITGLSTATNVSYQWVMPGSQSASGKTISVIDNGATPSTTVFGSYTLMVSDLTNNCSSQHTFTVYRNFFVPNPFISATPHFTLGCGIQTVVLLNMSSSGIPPNLQPIFGLPIVAGYLWQGPAPLQPATFSSTYLANVPGTYSLTVRDVNNGCFSNTTTTVSYDALCTNINEHPTRINLGLYPNPSDGIIILRGLDEPIEFIKIYNQFGEIVFEVKHPANRIQLDASLANGIYFLEAIFSNKISYSRFLLNKNGH